MKNFAITLTLLATLLLAGCIIDLKAWVTGVSLDKTTLSLVGSDSEVLTPEIRPADAGNKNVSWTSDNTAVAEVDDSGLVTAVAPGTATITVTTDDGGKTAQCTVTVTATLVATDNARYDIPAMTEGTAIKSIDLSKAAAGGKAPLSFSAGGLPAGITLSKAGMISGTPTKPFAAGTATITVTDSGTPPQSAIFVINYGAAATKYVPVTSVTLSQETLALEVGQNASLIPAIAPKDATDQKVTWESSAPGVATVGTDGRITAVGTGTAVITVTAAEGKTDNCTVTVTPRTIPVTSISIAPADEVSVMVGTTTTLSATVLPTDATDSTIKWSSGNIARATVDPVTGIVTGVSAGTVVITAAANDKSGVQVSKEITVLPVAIVAAGAITGVTSPVAMALPSSGVNPGTGYTAALTWIGNPSKFNYGTIYSADITLSALPGYTFTGNYTNTAQVAGFTVNGIPPVEWLANDGKTLRIRVRFPQTAPVPVPVVTILTHPNPSTTVTHGHIKGNLSVVATATQGTPNYTWYRNTTDSNEGGTPVGNLAQSFPIPTWLGVGTHFFYCSVGAHDLATGVSATPVLSNVAIVTVQSKSVFVGVQSAPAIAGKPAGATFEVTTNFAAGQYDAALVNPPEGGWSLANPDGKITIGADGKGVLNMAYDGSGGKGVYSQSVTIDGALSNEFELRIEAPTITIATQPSAPADPIAPGEIITLSIEATMSNGVAPVYEWRQNDKDSTQGATPVGTDAAEYTPPSETEGTKYYFCKVYSMNDASIFKYSDIVKVTVEE